MREGDAPRRPSSPPGRQILAERQTKREERREPSRIGQTRLLPYLICLQPAPTRRFTASAALTRARAAGRKKRRPVAEGEEARWREVFHQRNPRAHAPRHPSPRCTTGLPSDGSHDLVPANPSDGALRKLTLVGQTTMCNRMCDFASHLSARFKWTSPRNRITMLEFSRVAAQSRDRPILSRFPERHGYAM